MISITDKSGCCGCSACQAICPHDAVVMLPDGMGFQYPVVNRERCVDCGLCDNVCDFTKGRKAESSRSDMDVYAARHKDGRILSRSQSGGAFTAISDVVLEGGGVIYGEVFDRDLSVRHSRAVTAEERNLFCSSKYIQSRMEDTFRSVLNDVKSGRQVLFSGTPCQVAGLKSYVPDRYLDSIIFLDFVCHGVPSPAVWKSYVEDMGRYGKIVSACFRDKSLVGWKGHKESFAYSDGSTRSGETFRVLFYKNIMLRPGCGSCKYDIYNRSSDISIADFWGIDEICPQMDGNSGTSMIIVHTEKGKKLFAEAAAHMEIQHVPADISRLAKRNPNLLAPTGLHPASEEFEKAFIARGFRYVAARWGDRGWRYKAWQVKCSLRKLLGKK